MKEPKQFGALVRCRLGEEEGLALTTGNGFWTFQGTGSAITRGGAIWRDLEAVEILNEGVER